MRSYRCICINYTDAYEKTQYIQHAWNVFAHALFFFFFYKHIVKKNMQSLHKYSQIKNVSTLYYMN